MVRRSTSRILPLVSGVAGVVVAHAAAYLLAFPSPDVRNHELHNSGHGYWDHAVLFAVVAGVVALVQAAGRGIRRGRAGVAPKRCSFGRQLLGLAVWQLALFAGMEVVERAVAGVPPGALLRDPAFVVGVVLQVAVAAVILLLLGGVEHLAAEVARRLRCPRFVERQARLAALADFILCSRRCSPAAPRAPPRSALT